MSHGVDGIVVSNHGTNRIPRNHTFLTLLTCVCRRPPGRGLRPFHLGARANLRVTEDSRGATQRKAHGALRLGDSHGQRHRQGHRARRAGRTLCVFPLRLIASADGDV